jgi:hypothetical protein
MSSGGGSNQPTNQTVTQTTIPEYARPYVERALGQAGALTDINQNPYQAYQGERFAQFTPLQQQSFQGAYQMQPSQQLTTATGLATGAGLGALGMVGQYNPYQTGQFTGSTAQQYMSPYMQNVVDIEKREAQRASDVAAQRDQAAFARAGAFGGARQAIVEAERARNLGTQMGDIQAKGLQTAYQQAADQFGREQQLREQSRQYGAGLGMQGLQTGLQAAGQLGQLGGQQFQQGMDINKLQQQYGMQQQQQMQNILNAQYQDYLNAKQYPYQQLGFMSDMLRGLPLSQQYSQTYQQPPSMLGQLAGLGMGAYGMFGRKEGGVIKSYAEGGVSDTMDYADHNEPVTFMAYGGSVTDERFVQGAIDRLSNEQLKQALQNAMNRQDARLVNLIQQEMQQRAESASFQSGLASAAPENMEDMLPTEEGMRRGGIVSFADRGLVEGSSTASPEFGISSPEQEAMDTFRVQEAQAGKERARLSGIADMIQESNPELAARLRPREPAVLPPAAPKEAAPKRESKAEAAPQKQVDRVSSVISTAVAKETGFPKNDLENVYDRLLKKMGNENKQLFDEVRSQIAVLAKRPEDIRKDANRKALAEFGFAMAAAAAQPGAGRGLAGALRSAAAAAPTLTASMAESEKAARAAEDVTAKMRLEQARYELAMRKGDQQTAMQAASNIERLGLMRQQIAQAGASSAAALDLRRQALAQQGEQFRQTVGLKGLQAASQLAGSQARLGQVRAKAMSDFDSSREGRELKTTLGKQNDPQKAAYLYNQRRNEYVGSVLGGMPAASSRGDEDLKVPSVFDLLGDED